MIFPGSGPSNGWSSAHLLNDLSGNDRAAVKDAGLEHDAPIPLRYPVGANQLRSEVMPDEILTLGHHEFIQRVQEIEISPLDRTGLLLRLCASVEVHSTERPAPEGTEGPRATLSLRR